MPEIIPSMLSFTVGCPYGLPGVDPQQATPLVLHGAISGVNRESRKIYTSAPTFPGNSGGPLLVVRPPFDPSGRTIMVGSPTVLLAGIMLESALLSSPIPGDKIPPLHLGVAAPIEAVFTLLDSPQAQELESRLPSKQ
jgi:S1-C subfamily serine protease